MFDRLPTPFGLVRAGVAPDHPKIKSVIRVYEKTAARDGFRFFGNVEVGRDVHVAELDERYHAVVYAYGTATDRKLGIPGEDLPGSYPATDFVAWYNAHPDYSGHDFDLACRRAVVIGNGNVAADVARMLALPRSELETTDTADHAIEVLSGVGDRGDRRPRPPRPGAGGVHEPRGPRARRADRVRHRHRPGRDGARRGERAVDRLRRRRSDEQAQRRDLHASSRSARRRASAKRLVLRFCCSPVEIRGDGRVESIVIGHNELVEEDGRIVARDTGEREELECGLVLRSIGYRGVELEGVPFDSGRGLIPNEAGRVQSSDRRAQARPLRGRLDQARPVRRHRDQQEGRPRDRPGHLRGPRTEQRYPPVSSASPPGRRPGQAGSVTDPRSCSPSGETTSPTSAGRRSTPPRRPPASRTAGRGSSSARSRR